MLVRCLFCLAFLRRTLFRKSLFLRRGICYLLYPFSAEKPIETKNSLHSIFRNENGKDSQHKRATDGTADISGRYAEHIYGEYFIDTSDFCIAACAEDTAYCRIRDHSYDEPVTVYDEKRRSDGAGIFCFYGHDGEQRIADEGDDHTHEQSDERYHDKKTLCRGKGFFMLAVSDIFSHDDGTGMAKPDEKYKEKLLYRFIYRVSCIIFIAHACENDNIDIRAHRPHDFIEDDGRGNAKIFHEKFSRERAEILEFYLYRIVRQYDKKQNGYCLNGRADNGGDGGTAQLQTRQTTFSVDKEVIQKCIYKDGYGGGDERCRNLFRCAERRTAYLRECYENYGEGIYLHTFRAERYFCGIAREYAHEKRRCKEHGERKNDGEGHDRA